MGELETREVGAEAADDNVTPICPAGGGFIIGCFLFLEA